MKDGQAGKVGQSFVYDALSINAANRVADLERDAERHRSRIEALLRQLDDLRSLYLMAALDRALTVSEAKALGVCRICRAAPDAKPPFVWDHGSEHAHEGCLRIERYEPLNR